MCLSLSIPQAHGIAGLGPFYLTYVTICLIFRPLHSEIRIFACVKMSFIHLLLPVFSWTQISSLDSLFDFTRHLFLPLTRQSTAK